MNDTDGVNMIQTFLDYNRSEAWLLSKAEQIQRLNFDLIVGILRGGAFPAVVLSHATHVPVAFMRFDREQGVPSWDSAGYEATPGKKILLCDDFAGSGVTLLRCLAWLEANRCEVQLLTLAYDSLSRLEPEFAMDLRGHKVVFPHERYSVSEKNDVMHANLDCNGLGAMPSDLTLEQWAYDLDGVFLPDVPEAAYEQDLQHAIRTRHAMPKDPMCPPVRDGAYIITGRPDEDEALTLAWLRRERVPFKRLVMRDSASHEPTATWRHKAEAILRHGVSHFVESCPRQALLVATHCPHVRVMNWDIETGSGIWVSAFRSETDPVDPQKSRADHQR